LNTGAELFFFIPPIESHLLKSRKGLPFFLDSPLFFYQVIDRLSIGM
jgi:hypothetical protein